MTKTSRNRKSLGKPARGLRGTHILPSLAPKFNSRICKLVWITSPLLPCIDFILEFKAGHTLSNSPQAKLTLQRLESSH